MPELRAGPIFSGLNLIDDESSLKEHEATQALNVNLDKGTIKKRDGYVGVATTASVLGITDYRKLDGSVQQIIKSGTDLKKLLNGSLTSITGGGSLPSGTLADFAVYGDKCYMVDGEFHVTDGSNAYSVTITRPDSSGISIAQQDWALAETGLSGTYDYKFTYKSVSWQIESAASVLTAPQKLDDQQVAFTSIPRSSDTRMVGEKIRIYRRKTSEQQTMWFLLTEIANPGAGTASYTDQVLDEAVDPFETAPFSEEYDLDAKDFRHIELHKGVMFLAPHGSSELYFSLPDRPTVISDSIVIGNEAQHGIITGLLSWQGLLYVFKEDSVWSLDGLTKDTFNLSPISNSMGCYSGHSIVSTDDAVYFLGEDSILGFDGSRISDVGVNVRSLIGGRNRARDAYFFGANDKDNRSVIWSYSPVGTVTNSKSVVMFYGNSQRVQGPSWTTWEFKKADGTSAPLQCMARVTTSASTMDRKLWYGFDTKIGEPGGFRDDSTGDFALIWTTGKWDGEVPERYKAWGNFSIEIDKETAGSVRQALKIKVFLDSDEFDLFTRGRNMSRTINTTRVRARSRDLKLEFQHDTAASGCNIISFVLEGKGAGAFRARRN